MKSTTDIIIDYAAAITVKTIPVHNGHRARYLVVISDGTSDLVLADSGSEDWANQHRMELLRILTNILNKNA